MARPKPIEPLIPTLTQFTEKQREWLKSTAKEAGMPMGEFLRMMVDAEMAAQASS
jgi:hypothetical protein